MPLFATLHPFLHSFLSKSYDAYIYLYTRNYNHHCVSLPSCFGTQWVCGRSPGNCFLHHLFLCFLFHFFSLFFRSFVARPYDKMLFLSNIPAPRSARSFDVDQTLQKSCNLRNVQICLILLFSVLLPIPSSNFPLCCLLSVSSEISSSLYTVISLLFVFVFRCFRR